MQEIYNFECRVESSKKIVKKSTASEFFFKFSVLGQVLGLISQVLGVGFSKVYIILQTLDRTQKNDKKLQKNVGIQEI